MDLGPPKEIFDEDTKLLIARLHDAWSNKAPLEAYLRLREELMQRRDRVDTGISTLSVVVQVALDHRCIADGRWKEFFQLARNIDCGGIDDGQAIISDQRRRKRKRMSNELSRTRNLAVVGALWSTHILEYYGWDDMGTNSTHIIRQCALTYPNFMHGLCPLLNKVLLSRHKQALRHGRGQTLQEAPLLPLRDLDPKRLAASKDSLDDGSEWLHNHDGNVPIDNDGTKLIDVRPDHFWMYLLTTNQFGVFVCRESRMAVRKDFALPATQLPVHSQQLPVNCMLTDTSHLGSHAQRHAQVGDLDCHVLTHDELSPNQDTLSDGLSSCAGHCTINSDLWSSRTRWTDVEISNLEVDSSWTSLSPLITAAGAEQWTSTEGCMVPISSTEIDTTALMALNATHSISKTSSICATGQEGATAGGRDWPYPSGFVDFDDADLNAYLTAGIRSRNIENTYITSTLHTNGTPRSRQANMFRDLSVMQPSNTHMETFSLSQQHPSQTNLPSTVVNASSCNIDQFTSGTLESRLQQDYKDVIARYIDQIQVEAFAAPSASLSKLRAGWLGFSTKWAKIYSCDHSELQPGTALSEESADVLYHTAASFDRAAQSHARFRKPVVIKEKFMDSKMHTIPAFLKAIRDISTTNFSKVLDLDGKKVPSCDLDDIEKEYQLGDQGKDGTSTIRVRSLTGAHAPLFTMLPRFRLLWNMANRMQSQLSQKALPLSPEPSRDLTFNLLKTSGAFSNPRPDAIGGMWLRILSGVKLWTIVPTSERQEERTRNVDSNKRHSHSGMERLILLEEDDIVFLAPGLRLVHAFHSPKTCLVEGGTIWDERSIIPTLEGIQRIWKDEHTVNEPIAQHLHDILGELERFVTEQPERFVEEHFEEFKRKFDAVVLRLRSYSY